MVVCRCDWLRSLSGPEAEQYANAHLTKVSVDPATWSRVFECADAKVQWLMDFPDGDADTGPARLRRLRADGRPLI